MNLLDPAVRTNATPPKPAAAPPRATHSGAGDAASGMADRENVSDRALERLSARLLMSIGAVAVVAAPLLMLAYRSTLSGPALIASFVLPCLLGLAFLAAGMALRRGNSTAAYVTVLTAGYGVVVSYAVVTQVGVHSVVSGFLVLFIAAAGVLLSGAWAVGFGVASAFALIALYFAETAGLIAGKEVVQAIPVLSRTLAALLMIAVSILTTLLLSRLVVNALRDKLKQELRFRALLGIASDWYWEQDVELRYTRVSAVVADSAGKAVESNLGLARWELPGIDPLASDWDVHRADLMARRAFRDFRYVQTRADGSQVTLAASGEPTFDSLGQFTGYWGVTRDVTDEERARAALRTSDQRFRELFMASPSPFILHRNGVVLFGNRAAAARFGFAELKDFEGFDIAQLTAPDDRALTRSRLATLEQSPLGGAVPTIELKMVKLDGTQLTVEVRAIRVDLADGPANLSLYIDLTERKLAEIELRKSRALLSQLVEANPDFVALSELETGRYVMVNEGLTRMTGYSCEEAIGRSSLDLGLWFDAHDRDDLVSQLRAYGSVRAFPALMRGKDGRVISTLISAATIEVDGRTLVTSTVRDVTDGERLRLEYEAILSNASIGIAITRDRAFHHANPRFEQIYGWPAGALAGQSGSVVWLSDDDYLEFGRTAGPVLARGEPIELERRMRRRDGSVFIARILGRAIDPMHPSRGGTIWIADDITGRRVEQERLAQSQALLSQVVEANPEYVALSELETGEFIVVNEGFTRMVGYERSEAIGRGAVDLGVWFDPIDRDNFVAQLRAHGSVRAFPARLRCKDGRIISTLISSATFVVDGRALVSSTVRDVTDSERARLEYEAILANASIGIAFTRDRVIHHANPRWEEMYGWPVGSLIGQPGSVVWLSDDDYADVGRRAGPVLARGEPVELERPMRRRDGSVFLARMLGRAIDPTHPSRGGTIWIAEDITERRATQDALAAAKGQAEAASHAKSAFLANTSHEIRTPLNGLLGLARLAVDRKVSDVQRLEYLKGIHESAEQLGGLISDILDLSKIEAGKFTLESVSFDLHAMLGNVYAGYRELASGKGLACSLHLDPRVPRYVTGDPTRVRQVVSNFVTNALKFTERGQVDLCAEMMERGAIRLAVVDSGLGIDEATLARLFTPFTQADESTTRRYGGTGLGLSICRQLADLMGGTVGVDSEPGVGSTFWAELPLPAAADAPEAQAAIEESSLAGVRVLLVEDNAVNMLIAATLLESWDAEVKQVTDGRQAVDTVTRLQQDPATAFDLVLMDVHMPVMSGHEATIALRKHFSKENLPIVALTAAALLNEQEASLALGMNDFVTKPVDANRLRSVVARWARRTVRT